MRQLLVLAVATLGITCAFAQEAGPAGGAPIPAQIAGATSYAKYLKYAKQALEQVSLTSDQKKKLTQLGKETRKKLRDTRAIQDRKEQRKKAAEILDEHQKQFESILTKEQQDKFQKAYTQLVKKARSEQKSGAGAKPSGDNAETSGRG